VFSPDSQMLMTGSFDKTAQLWRITTKQATLALAMRLVCFALAD
jgi:WD40 repeat protein